jgi:hypothetical protein
MSFIGGLRHSDWWISISVSQHWLSNASKGVDKQTRISTVVTIRQRNQSDSTKKKQHECLNGQGRTHNSAEETIASREYSVVDVFSFRCIVPFQTDGDRKTFSESFGESGKKSKLLFIRCQSSNATA